MAPSDNDEQDWEDMRPAYIFIGEFMWHWGAPRV